MKETVIITGANSGIDSKRGGTPAWAPHTSWAPHAKAEAAIDSARERSGSENSADLCDVSSMTASGDVPQKLWRRYRGDVW